MDVGVRAHPYHMICSGARRLIKLFKHDSKFPQLCSEDLGSVGNDHKHVIVYVLGLLCWIVLQQLHIFTSQGEGRAQVLNCALQLLSTACFLAAAGR